jgi:hypothetical protein
MSGLLYKLTPEALESEAKQLNETTAFLLKQWAAALVKPGLTMDEQEAIMMEIKLSAAWITVGLNKRKEAAKQRQALQPSLELWRKIAGDMTHE